MTAHQKLLLQTADDSEKVIVILTQGDEQHNFAVERSPFWRGLSPYVYLGFSRLDLPWNGFQEDDPPAR